MSIVMNLGFSCLSYFAGTRRGLPVPRGVQAMSRHCDVEKHQTEKEQCTFGILDDQWCWLLMLTILNPPRVNHMGRTGHGHRWSSWNLCSWTRLNEPFLREVPSWTPWDGRCLFALCGWWLCALEIGWWNMWSYRTMCNQMWNQVELSPNLSGKLWNRLQSFHDHDHGCLICRHRFAALSQLFRPFLGNRVDPRHS